MDWFQKLVEFAQIRANVQNRNLTLNVQVDGAMRTATITNIRYVIFICAR